MVTSNKFYSLNENNELVNTNYHWNTRYYVYIHLNDKKQLFYVGKGCNKRGVSAKGRNLNWTKEYIDSEWVISFKLFDNLSEYDAENIETEIIYRLQSILKNEQTRKPNKTFLLDNPQYKEKITKLVKTAYEDYEERRDNYPI